MKDTLSLPWHLTSIQLLTPGCSGTLEGARTAWSKTTVKFSETLEPVDIMLVARSGRGWEYLHHRNRQNTMDRLVFFSLRARS